LGYLFLLLKKGNSPKAKKPQQAFAGAFYFYTMELFKTVANYHDSDKPHPQGFETKLGA
jgi:hypothetical protein